MLTITVELNGYPVGNVTVGSMDDGGLLSRATQLAVLKAVQDLLDVGLVQSARIEVLQLYPVHTCEVCLLPVRTSLSAD